MKSQSTNQAILFGIVVVIGFATVALGCNSSAIRSIIRVVRSSSSSAVRSGTTRVAQQAGQSAAGEVVAKTTGEIVKKLAVGFGKYVAPVAVIGTADVVGDTIRSNKDAHAMEVQLADLKEHQMQLLEKQELAATVRRNHEKELKKMELEIYQARKPQVTIEELPADFDETVPIPATQSKQPLRDQPNNLDSLLQDGLQYALQKPISDLSSILVYFGGFIAVLVASTISILCCCYCFNKLGRKRRANRFGLPVAMNASVCTLFIIGLALAVAGYTPNSNDEDATESHVKELLRAGWIPPWLSPKCIIPGDLELDMSEMGWILFRSELRALQCERLSAELQLKCTSPEVTYNNVTSRTSVLTLGIMVGALLGYCWKTSTDRCVADNSKQRMKKVLDCGALAIFSLLFLSFLLTSQAAVIGKQSLAQQIAESFLTKVEVVVDERIPIPDSFEVMEEHEVSDLGSNCTNNFATKGWHVWQMVATLSQELFSWNCGSIYICSKVKLLKLLLVGGLSLTFAYIMASLLYLRLKGASKK